MLLQEQSKNSIDWLKCGIFSLALAGLYSIILVALRTPGLSKLFQGPEIFKSALVVHVNLSVLVWLLSFSASIWCLRVNSFVATISNKVAIAGALLIAISPFVGESEPITNNYVPMLENIFFILGLSTFGASILIISLYVIFDYFTSKNCCELINIASVSSALLFITTCGCFVLSYLELQKYIGSIPIELDYFYELLFWGGGHILQFVYTQILMISWLILWEKYFDQPINNKKLYATIFILNLALALLGLYGYYKYENVSGEFVEFFSKHMKHAGGIAPVACLLLLIYSTLRLEKPTGIVNSVNSIVAKAGLLCSILLFGFGGVIGILISGINVTVPAHYHGSIVGISIAFIALSYLLTSDQFTNSKSAYWQIIILSMGQLLHISGLAMAGGYGVMRKTPGVELALPAKVGMALMGTGGLIAIIGGLMFVFICGGKILKR